MKRITSWFPLVSLLGCAVFFTLALSSCNPDEVPNVPDIPTDVDLSNSFYYTINLNESNDLFKVEVVVNNLGPNNSIFQFAATAPGTYSVMDFGRYVTSFKAYNKNLKELRVDHPNKNQWVLSEPENTRYIQYEILETFDTGVTDLKYFIYPMAGTSIENDHCLLNSFAVLGYVTGLKNRNFYVKVNMPTSWSVGTSLPELSDDLYYAPNYNFLVDNPLLMGTLTSASTSLNGTMVNVHVYSKDHYIQASQILPDINQVLANANAFLGGLPVDHYNFLFHFEALGGGALEHSYSSVYVFRDGPYSNYGSTMKDFTAHEFFHIVTPLNIHSEIIENFNFVDPTPSQHLWLYEGVTEWAAHIMQYRYQSITLNELLKRFSSKLVNANSPSRTLSLTDLGIKCYTEEGATQYVNIYNKGAIVAALLDIRLLELSHGEKGLRELLLTLIQTYGPEHSFSEAGFFNFLVENTYPQINDSINRYIKGIDPLPYNEYLGKLGIVYDLMSQSYILDPSANAEQKMLFEKWSRNF